MSLDSRFGSGLVLGGSVDTGRSVQNNCFVVDSPQQLLNCRVVTPFKAQTLVKVHGSYPLPGEFVASGILQNLSGIAYDANYPVSNANIMPSLGRNLSACGTRTPCTADGDGSADSAPDVVRSAADPARPAPEQTVLCGRQAAGAGRSRRLQRAQ